MAGPLRFERRNKESESFVLPLDYGPIWCPEEESNPYLKFRKLSFCPLNYQSKYGTPERNRTPIEGLEDPCLFR